MTAATFRGGSPLHGRLRLPGDKSLSHRALIFGALAAGRCEVRGLSDGDDVRRTRLALETSGVIFIGERIEGGRSRFLEAVRPLDLGNSGTGIRLLLGVYASFDFLTVLVGDDSIHRRPMGRVAAPLRQMGAHIDGRAGGDLAPLAVRGGALSGIDYTTAVPSAQIKSAVLLAGLGAQGPTTVRQEQRTRRHTEEFFELTGISFREFEEDGLACVTMEPGEPAPFSFDVPGDPSQAAFLVVAASLIPGSEIVLENVYVGKERAGFLAVLERMGAAIERQPVSATTADLVVRSAPLQATTIAGAEVADCIDELPALAVAAAFAEGTTTIADAAELRLKESDRIETMAAGLRAFGGEIDTLPDGMVVRGGGLRPEGQVDSAGDHRVAMALAVAALVGEEPVVVDGFDAVDTSWPGFVEALEFLR